jgi:hypothetical protein
MRHTVFIVDAMEEYPLYFSLEDGTHVMVNQIEPAVFEFHLTRLNSEKHNFTWYSEQDEADSSYDTRFDEFEKEAIKLFKEKQRQSS